MQIVKQMFGELEVRYVTRDGEIWVVAADAAQALGISNPTQALKRLDEDEVTLISNEGQSGVGVNYISESGLYSLILGSRKPQAKPFKRWVTHDLLPTLRRTGLYSARDQSAQAQALESAGRHELVMDAKFELLHKMAVQVVTAACVGQAYGGGKVKALYQLGVKNIHPLGYFTSLGKEVEVYPMLDVFQQFNAGMGPPAGRALLACEWEWTPYPVARKHEWSS